MYYYCTCIYFFGFRDNENAVRLPVRRDNVQFYAAYFLCNFQYAFFLCVIHLCLGYMTTQKFAHNREARSKLKLIWALKYWIAMLCLYRASENCFNWDIRDNMEPLVLVRKTVHCLYCFKKASEVALQCQFILISLDFYIYGLYINTKSHSVLIQVIRTLNNIAWLICFLVILCYSNFPKTFLIALGVILFNIFLMNVMTLEFML